MFLLLLGGQPESERSNSLAGLHVDGHLDAGNAAPCVARRLAPDEYGASEIYLTSCPSSNMNRRRRGRPFEQGATMTNLLGADPSTTASAVILELCRPASQGRHRRRLTAHDGLVRRSARAGSGEVLRRDFSGTRPPEQKKKLPTTGWTPHAIDVGNASGSRPLSGDSEGERDAESMRCPTRIWAVLRHARARRQFGALALVNLPAIRTSGRSYEPQVGNLLSRKTRASRLRILRRCKRGRG